VLELPVDLPPSGVLRLQRYAGDENGSRNRFISAWPSVPAHEILTTSHKGRIWRVFLIGITTIPGEIYRVIIPGDWAVRL
jgi:hypothetical protein